MSQQYSYRPRMNRNITRKWAEARQVDYDGDDWGAEPYAEDPSEPQQQPVSYRGRSFTNPVQPNPNHRLSFDQSPEQRVFSAGAAGSQTGFPPANQTASQFSQPPGFQQDRFQPRYPEQPQQQYNDQYRPMPPAADNRAPVTATRSFPPRKSSLSQPDIPNFQMAQQSQQSPPQRSPSPPPDEPARPAFIRPADIYKRMDEEREKERRSQDSSRPSLDSVQRDPSEIAPKQSTEESTRRLKPNLDTVAERRSEYGMEGLLAGQSPTQPTVSQENPAQIDTSVPQVQSIPSASSRYTDRPESMVTDSQFPSRHVSQHDSTYSARPSFLPQVSRTSTFGSDFFRSASLSGHGTAPVDQQSSPPQPATIPASARLDSTATSPYKTMVDTAFQSENNQNLASPTRTDDSLLRSNTTSTSQISPIVGGSREADWDPSLSRNVDRSSDRGPEDSMKDVIEDLGTPKRVGTNRRDSPSPARKPLSMEIPPVSEPQSAVLSPGHPEMPKDVAREAQFTRPGPAILVHQRGTSTDMVPKVESSGMTSDVGTKPDLREQTSHLSETSDHSNLRSASEEWRDWSKTRKEFNARYGIKDSNPTTPGVDSSGLSSPAPTFDSLDKNVSSTTNASSGDNVKPASGTGNFSSASRPPIGRDESFRPQLPGGWESSTSIQKTSAPTGPEVSQSRPDLSSSASAESIPTAGAPRQADWRSEYTGPQAQAFAAAAAAGTALAGIFSGSALTSGGGDSEVSSINDHDDHPTGRNRDSSLATRDFASSTPTPPAVPEKYATRDFASPTSTVNDNAQTTPKASQQPFSSEVSPHAPGIVAPLKTRSQRSSVDDRRAESPSKESERWWSDEEDADAPTHAPAPLRTKRLSTTEPSERRSPAVSLPSQRDFDSTDPEKLESDIVKSLTPKSSKIQQPERVDLGTGPQLSPTRTQGDRAGSPPFAAAALAMSPARNYTTLREQNAFNPLGDQQSPSRSPTRDLGLGGSSNIGPSQASSGLAQSELKARSSPDRQTPLPNKDKELPPIAPQGIVQNQPQTVQPARFGSQDISSVSDKPTVLGKTRDQQSNSSKQSSPAIGSDRSLGSNRPQETKIPATSVEARRTSIEQYPHSSTANEAVTISDPSSSSLSTPSKIVTIGGPVKQQNRASLAVNDTTPQPLTPVSVSHDSPTISSPLVSTSDKINQPQAYDANRPFPSDKVPIEQIFGMGTAQQRIQAYQENREAYAQPVGHLENWLSQMKIDEQDEAFSTPSRAKTEYATASPRHRREDSNPSGSKIMQEDGKRILASASKYGAKASVLGKGLFSKGKEKLRSVSTSQKEGMTNRKTSNNVHDAGKSTSASTSSNSVPQLPTPVMGTPVDDSAFSAYFPPKHNAQSTQPGMKAAVAPPFSPISEVSVAPSDSHRPLSAVSDQPLPRSDSSAHFKDNNTSGLLKTSGTKEDDKRKSAGGISALESEHDDRRVSADLLTPSHVVDERQNSSVSDVSSVSDASNHRHNQAARTISPPMEHQVSRDDPSSMVPTVTPQVTSAQQNNRPQHAPSYSTAMASKEAEAARDRSRGEDQPLPAYSQPAQTKPAAILPGTQVVPIARLRQDQTVRAEEPRPFSFVGQETVLHTAHGTNHSIDHPGVNVGSEMSNAPVSHPEEVVPGAASRPDHAVSATPIDREGPSKPSRIVTQAQAEQQYRIPGPYGHELRSPRPKNSSPMLEQFQTPATPHSPQLPIDASGDGSASQRPITSEYTPFPPQQNMQSQNQPYASNQMVDTRPQGSQYPIGQQSAIEGDRPYQEVRDRERSGDRGRTSKFSALFRNRSKSRSRRVQKEKSRQSEQRRPENDRRNSLFKLGGRNSMSRENSYDNAQRQGYGGEYDDTDDSAQMAAQPDKKSRRLSKDLLKGATFSQPDRGQGNFSQQSPAASSKKKRFSGIFGKSPGRPEPTYSHNIARSSTMPVDSQQASGVTQRSNFPSMATAGSNADDVYDRENNEGYRQYAQARDQSQPNQSFYEDVPLAQQSYGRPANQSDTYGNPTQFQQGPSRGQPDQYSVYSNASYQKQPLAGSPYQHENRPNAYDQGQQYQYEQPRPILPRINTGERQSGSSTPVPASAPPVPSSYIQARQNQDLMPQQTHTLPLDSSHQDVHQLSFPQPPSLSQYHQPPTTRAARDISHNSHVNDRTMPYGSNNDYNNQSIASPLPMSPPFSASTNQANSAFSGFSRANENQPTQAQTMPAYSQPQGPATGSRITPRVAQLHVRSRSPKLGRPSSEDLSHEYSTSSSLGVNPSQSANTASPVAGLGTFTSKKVSPIGGIPRSAEEQEKPWALSLPVDEEEQRRREDDPASATTSRAREMRRMMLERSPVATPVTAGPTQLPLHQPIADRTASQNVPQQSKRSNDYQPPLPGTTKVIPDSRTSTPVGRPTTPSVTLRRDASLRGKGARSSTMIDEAGRTITVRSTSQKRDTSGPLTGQPLTQESMDSARSISAIPRDSSHHDTTTSRTSSLGKTSSVRTNPSPPPPVPSLPRDTTGIPMNTRQTREPATEQSIPPTSAIKPTAPPSALAAPSTANTSSPTTSKEIPPMPAPISESEPQTEPQPASNLKPKPTPLDTTDTNKSTKPASAEIYEMAGSRPEGYESEDEPVMSATAYPGQEWQPVFDRWEDEFFN